MKLYIYSIKDNLQGAYMNPFYLQNDNVAIRSFKNIIQNAPIDNNVRMNAKDMSIYKLGEFDEETGLITSDINFLANGGDFIVLNQPKGENE